MRFDIARRRPRASRVLARLSCAFFIVIVQAEGINGDGFYL